MKSLFISIGLCVTLPALAFQSESLERQHGAHVHGQATGTLAVDAERLSLSLVVPGMNLVGFEHAPNDEAQRERLQEVKRTLEAGAWLEVDPDGDCRLDRIELATPGFAIDRDRQHSHEYHDHDRDHGGHDHGHQDHRGHDGDSHHHDHEHAEFQLDVSVECAGPRDLAWVDLGLFDDFPANEEMRIDVLTETRAERVRLSANSSRIRLR